MISSSGSFKSFILSIIVGRTGAIPSEDTLTSSFSFGKSSILLTLCHLK